jgi:hypothetical protein
MSDIQPITDQIEVINKKRIAWGNLGVEIHNLHLSLQVQGQGIINRLLLPTETARIPQAEEILAQAKRDKDALYKKRLETTNKLDDVKARLMQPEKSVNDKIAEYIDGLIKLKKKKKDEDDAAQIKLDELKKIAENVRLYIANQNAAYLKEHADLISKSYIYALEKVPPEQLEPYLAKIRARITIGNRTMQKPSFGAINATQEEVNAEIDKAFQPQPAQYYVSGFVHDLNVKYADYTQAWDNKDQALYLNTQETAQNHSAIEQAKTEDVVAANIQSMATSVLVTTDSKELNEVFVLNMPETFEAANIIVMAYLANSAKCRTKLRVTKWLTGFGIQQMSDALEKIKNEDNNFNFSGLIWTTKSKL